VKAALERGARAVVVAHLYGLPTDLAELNRLAAAAGAIVIEDAAQAAGASVRGRPAGSQASVSVLSFGRGKGLTGGNGGALLAMDEQGERLLDRIKQRNHLGTARRGWRELAAVSAQWLLQRPGLYGIPSALPFLHLGETIYRTPQPVRAPASVVCPLISASWTAADREVRVRRRNAERLLAALQWQLAFQMISIPETVHPGYLRLPVLASPVAARAKALCDLERFGSRCLNNGGDQAFPGSRFLATRLCTLPTHGGLNERDLSALEQWIRMVETRR
jgi:dTDP-4-amino-4,6-dideoxygalactose transaminase